MTSYSEHYFENSSGLKLYYRRHGADKPGTPVVCLPGISRNSRDFHEIAEHMAAQRPVIAMDFRGRGLSDWDPQWRNYQPATYAADVLELLDELGMARVVLFGTSLGGLVSMIISANSPERVAAVTLNDIGPAIGAKGLARIMAYIGRAAPAANWDEAVAQARETYGIAWPGLSDDEWLIQARRGYRENDAGVPVVDLDPMVGEAARTVIARPEDPWVLFDKTAAKPVLLLHGETSDILTFDIVDRMIEKKPDLVHVVVSNRGHVPILDEPECITGIDEFLGEVEKTIA